MKKTNDQDLNGEEWRPVYKYENRYEISNYGRIKYLKTNNILRHAISNNGKHYIGLAGNGIKQSIRHGKVCIRQNIKRFEVAYLIAMTFKRAFHLNERYVRYIDGNFDNLKPNNISWTNHRGNRE